METLYPINPEVLKKYSFEELIPELVKALKTETTELQELQLEVKDDQESCTYHYKIYVKNLSLSSVDPILLSIIKFWDFNRMDDTIDKITLDYTSNTLSISWTTYC